MRTHTHIPQFPSVFLVVYIYIYVYMYKYVVGRVVGLGYPGKLNHKQRAGIGQEAPPPISCFSFCVPSHRT